MSRSELELAGLGHERARNCMYVWKPRSTISARNILIFAAPGAEACGALQRLAALCGQLRRTKFVCGRLRNACGSSVGTGW